MHAIVLLALARLLGAEEFGRFSVSLVLGTLIGLLTGFGSATQALRVGTSLEGRATATTLLIMRVVTGGFSAAIGTAVALLFGLTVHAAILVGLWVFSDLVHEDAQSVLFGQHQISRASFLIVLRRLIPLAALIGCIMLSATTQLLALSVGMAASLGIATVAVWNVLSRPLSFVSVIRSSRHYWTSTVLAGLQRADSVVVSAVSGTGKELGLYAAAARLASPLQLVTQSVLALLTPKLSELDEKGQRRLFRKALLGLGGMAVGIAVASPLVAVVGELLLGQDYNGARPFIIGALVAVGLSAVNQGFAAQFYAKDWALHLSHVRVWTVPSGLLVLAGLAAWGSTWGLALAPAAMQSVQLVSLAIVYRRREGL